MEHHQAVNLLVDAEKALVRARNICAAPGVIDEINTAFDKIWQVGDGLFPDIVNEVRAQKRDSMQ